MKIRVLQLGIRNFGIGGISTYIYELGQNFNKVKSDIIYDYLIFGEIPKKEYIDSIKKLGGKIYNKNLFHNKFLNIYYGIKNIEKDNNYEIIHINASVAYIALFYLLCINKKKYKKIIIHSHSNGIEGKNKKIKLLLHKLSREILLKYNVEKVACSKEAGIWMYKNNEQINIIYNGIDTEKYLFNLSMRNEMRKMLSLEDEIIIGCVARLSTVKNHKFLLKIFYLLQKELENSKLIIIGDGELRGEIELKIKELKLENKVLLIGAVKNVNDYLNAMDIFILPSLFEGFGLVGLEAQISDLYVFLSNQFPEEIKVSQKLSFISLDEDENYWLKQILLKYRKNEKREKKIEFLKSFYDIKKIGIQLEKIYKKNL